MRSCRRCGPLVVSPAVRVDGQVGDFIGILQAAGGWLVDRPKPPAVRSALISAPGRTVRRPCKRRAQCASEANREAQGSAQRRSAGRWRSWDGLGRRAVSRGRLAQAAPAARPAAPASDRIRVGMIGVGDFGTVNLRDFIANPDVDIVAVCDVDQRQLDRPSRSAGGKARPHKDYRRLLEDREIDAVVISTPEHWHALMCIDACQAGKDVYVEKPASHHIRDGRLMVDAARRNKRVVQVGSQQRSGAHFQRAVKYIQRRPHRRRALRVCWNHSPMPTPGPRSPAAAARPRLGHVVGPGAQAPYDEVMNVGRRGSVGFLGRQADRMGRPPGRHRVVGHEREDAAKPSSPAGGRVSSQTRARSPTPCRSATSTRASSSTTRCSPEHLWPQRRHRRGPLWQLRDAVPRHQGHAVPRSQRLPAHPPADAPGRAEPAAARPTPDSRQTGYYYTDRDLARAVGQLAAAWAARAQLPRLREEPQAHPTPTSRMATPPTQSAGWATSPTGRGAPFAGTRARNASSTTPRPTAWRWAPTAIRGNPKGCDGS